MATVRSIEVSALGRRSVDYQSNEVSVKAIVDLDDGENADEAIAKCCRNLQRHVNEGLEAWGVPEAPRAKPPARPAPPPWTPPGQRVA